VEGVFDYAHGVCAVDAVYDGRPLQTAVHLVVEDGRALIVDTAVAPSAPRVLAALAAKGVSPECVDWIFLTHVHLDHAGGAGRLMRACPRAQLAVHSRGARHVADPARLVAATRAIYGEEAVRRVYGEVEPVPAARIVEVADGARIAWGSREFLFLDAPGHARHHVAVRDSASGAFFVGDTFGLSYPALARDGRPAVFPTTSPSQFDPEALLATVDRLLEYDPPAFYLAHFGELRRPGVVAADFRRLVEAHAALALRARAAGAERHAALAAGVRALLLAERGRQGWPLAEEALLRLFALDVELNAQGLAAWLDTLPRKTAHADSLSDGR